MILNILYSKTSAYYIAILIDNIAYNFYYLLQLEYNTE